jgi:hypothetical protein
VSTLEELLGRKSSGSGLEIREYGNRDPSRWPRGTLYPQKLALTSSTSGGRSVGIVRSRTQITEFSSRQHCLELAFTAAVSSYLGVSCFKTSIALSKTWKETYQCNDRSLPCRGCNMVNKECRSLSVSPCELHYLQ